MKLNIGSKKESLKQLDYLLKILYWFRRSYTSRRIFETHLDQQETFENMKKKYSNYEKNADFKSMKLMEPQIEVILRKLVKDGYVDKTLYVVDIEGKEFEPSRDEFTINFDGLVFHEQGGYINQYNKERRAELTSTIINYTIAISGGIAAVYYLLEIFKNYIVPHCNCLYYAH